MIRAVAPAMKRACYGRIVNICGQNALQTGSLSAKGRNVALHALTTDLADELGPSGITVNLVHPGLTITERTEDFAVGMASREGTTPQEALQRIADGKPAADI